MIEQTVDDLDVLINDHEQMFFKEVMGFRDVDIQHAKDDALKFFNETYGLDFTLATPNEENEYVLENARLSLFRVPEDFHYSVISSNWIKTGSTRFSCNRIFFGGYHVVFSGDQLLHGSYGGVDGLPAGEENTMQYGYMNIDICDQSPVIIQYSHPSPFRFEPVDGTGIFHFDIYNNVLGYGKAVEVVTIKPDYDNPGKYRISSRDVFTFPAY